METIKVFRTSKRFAWFSLLFGSVILIFGGAGTIYSLISGFNTTVFGDWIYLINTIQGIVFVKMGIVMQKKERCFVGWDNSKIQYLLPGNKDIETIRISEITGIRLKLNEVGIRVNDTIKKLDLNNVEYEPLIKIKKYFKGLQSTLADAG